jgi:two-component system response regulator HydG
MQPLVSVLALSDSFSELWPKLIVSFKAGMRWGAAIAELETLAQSCCVVVSAAGAEVEAVRAVEQLLARQAPAIMVVGVETDYRLVAALLRAGADNYFALPADLGSVRSWVSDRVERMTGRDRAAELVADRKRRFDFSRMIGRSPCLLDAVCRAEKVIPRGAATVLLTGETGTGKELVARAIHYNGPRAAKPFVEINCTALPEHLLEAELFGFEAGAFTDARAPKPGLFESAHGGTLFLDEIGDISLALQAKLLRVLEDKRVRRLGSLRDQSLDVRVIAATHVNLPAAIEAHRFRRDLYYRLSVFPIHLPPLRDRGDDVLLLAANFLERFCNEYQVPLPSLSPEIQRVLRGYTWPGNVRELRNAVERAVLMGDGEFHARDLVPDDPIPSDHLSTRIPFPATMSEIERAAARAMTDWCGGNKSEAAKALGISRRHLYVLLAEGETDHA